MAHLFASVFPTIDPTTPLNLTVGTNNRITTTGFNYDLAGNLTSDVTSSYAWNAESEIKTANSVNYTYDGDGNRVQKSNGKIYWYGAGTEILDESDASGNFTDEYVFFGGKRVAHRSVSSGNIFYYAEDMLGSSRAMVQAGQTSVCYDADFYPYGGEKVVTNTCPQNYKFEGKERDTETGNDDFGARYYSSVYGRWLSPDWSSVPAPVPYANLNNPQTLNLYAMVADNPETFADLDGHETTGTNCDANTSVDCAGKIRSDKPPQPPPPQNSGNATDKTAKPTPQEEKSPDLQQQAAQATAQKRQEAIAKQNGPAPGSPEYIAKVSGQVNAEMQAGNKLIGAMAVVEVVGLAVVAAPAAATAYKATNAALITQPQALNVAAQAGHGAAAALAPGSTRVPMTPVGVGAYLVTKLARYLGGF
jgi:RHS repeat-associated protein